jgi:hypothetical protein
MGGLFLVYENYNSFDQINPIQQGIDGVLSANIFNRLLYIVSLNSCISAHRLFVALIVPQQRSR